MLLAFYDFPAEHWKHIRTTNPIESTFATGRLRTTKTKGCLSRMTALTMVFKLCQSASKKWRRLDGSPGLAAQRDDVFVGFEDPVRQPVVAHELPDILHRVQLGRSWRQRQDGDVVGDRQLGRQVPTGLITRQRQDGDVVGDRPTGLAGIDGGTDRHHSRRQIQGRRKANRTRRLKPASPTFDNRPAAKVHIL